MCGDCHKNFHSLYGHGQNTKEQFQEWFDKPLEDILKEFDGEIPTMRPIVCLETSEIILNIIDYCKQNGYNKRCIWRCCKNKSKAYNNHYLYYTDYIKLSDDEIQTIIKDYHSLRKQRSKVVKLDLDNNIISIYNNITEASILNNLSNGDGIYHCVMHDYKQSHGYKWEWFSYYCDNMDETKPSELLNKYLIVSK